MYRNDVVVGRPDVTAAGFERYVALVTRCIATAPTVVANAVSEWFRRELVPDMLKWHSFLQEHPELAQEAQRIVDKGLFHVERRIPDDAEEFEGMLYTALVSIRAGMARLQRVVEREIMYQPLLSYDQAGGAYTEFVMEVDGLRSGRYWTLTREIFNDNENNEAHLSAARGRAS